MYLSIYIYIISLLRNQERPWSLEIMKMHIFMEEHEH